MPFGPVGPVRRGVRGLGDHHPRHRERPDVGRRLELCGNPHPVITIDHIGRQDLGLRFGLLTPALVVASMCGLECDSLDFSDA